MKFLKITSVTPLLNLFGISLPESFSKKNSIRFLNISQCLGVINDNIFKLLIVFQFIDLYGVEKSPQVLFLTGVIFVLPFLLFSNAAGVLADYISKQKILAYLKLAEVLIMIFGIFAFWMQSTSFLYILLFLLSLQSACLGPSKYGIIPELVKPNMISKSNGTIMASTYLGMILGTFLASALTQATGRNFVLSGLVCLVFAAVGYLASLFIPETPANKDSKKRINPFFFVEIYRTLVNTKDIPFLHVAIFVSSYFLLIGAFFQLNAIPYAIETLGMTEVGGGYLFFTTAIGIAAGGYIGGKLCKHRIELGLPAAALFYLTVCIFLLTLLSFSLYPVLVVLMLVGFFGGLIVVPLESFIQANAPERVRGQVIAASSFMSFIGVLLASFSILIFNGKLGLSPLNSFRAVGLMTLCVSALVIRKMPHLFFNYLCRTLVNPLAGVKISNFPLDEKKPIVLIDHKYHWKHLIYLISYSSELLVCVSTPKRKWYHSILKHFTSLNFVYHGRDKKKSIESFLHHAKRLRKKIPCLVVQYEIPEERAEELQKVNPFILKRMEVSTVNRKERPGKLARSQVTIEISHEPLSGKNWLPF